jgi:hypothetical protein
MYTSTEKAAQILNLLLEGMSVNATARLSDTHHTTILRLLDVAGERCERLLTSRIQNIPVQDVECDEIPTSRWLT